MDISKELGAMTTIEVGASAVYGDEAVPALPLVAASLF